MNIIKTPNSRSLIPNLYFDICHLDGKTRLEISKLYQRKDVTTHKSCYYLMKFEHHIKTNFNLTLKEYCKKYLTEEWPRCPINNQEVGFVINGKGLSLAMFVATVDKEHSESFKRSCERMSEERKGEGNPMFGAKPWNKGLGLENPIIKANADKRRGSKSSEETKAKIKKSRAEHPLKARHTTPHSPETCEKLRIINAKKWADRIFDRKTSIEQKMEDFLKTLNLKQEFIYQYQINYFTVDFAFPESKIAIEADGDYYHINPAFYPDGPINAMQRRNFGRDKAKNNYLGQLGWTILRFWECEINSEVYKDKLVKQLRELNLLEINEN